MDFTPYLHQLVDEDQQAGLLSVAVDGRVALAMKGRLLLRCFCESLGRQGDIGCAVTDVDSCLVHLERDPYTLLLCTDTLESGNGFDLARRAKTLQPGLNVVVMALKDVIPMEYADAPWLQAVVAEADVIEDHKPLEAAVLAVMGGRSYRSSSLRSGSLPYLSCPRLTPREYEVLDLVANGLTNKEIATQIGVSEETARTYSKRLLRTLEVSNRVQAVLKGMRCGMVNL
ncbi:response regulator transcription factor [Synechococcus sp. RSCCF101]|uniref:response regulator transcription factor n=1 Tax=Synechococcus sp. RSCCF101 TaxID=2511069 RepID=UPI001244BE36|nr:response regulator transcription factor [Synechococcus sp. RSCCF101]QEY31292.1 response regulator transcription factor [Synechococcus sp. RSCCF101]